MTYLFILIAFATLYSLGKERNRLTSILGLIFISVLGYVQLEQLENPKYEFLLLPVVYLILNLFLANFKKIESLPWKFIFPVLLTLIFFIPLNIQIIYNEYIVDLTSISSVFIIVFGSLIIPVAQLKVKLVASLFDLVNVNQLETAVVLLLAGIGIFISNFLASYLGVYILGFGFLASTYFYKNAFQNTVVFILLFSSLNLFIALSGIDVLDLSLAKSAEGLLMGGALVLLSQSMMSARKYSFLATSITVFLLVFVMSGLMLIGTQKSDFGGVDSFLIALLAISFGFAMEMKGQMGLVVVSLLLGVGFLLAPLTINTEEANSMKVLLVSTTITKTSKSTEEKSPFESKGIFFDSIVGNYTINPESIQMNFELGPKGGRTKGAFKKMAGDISIKSNLSTSTFEINLPVSELTTFNKYRDESLMDEGYFNVNRFGKMTFTASKLNAINDGYEARGEFSMLGIRKNLVVQIKYIGNTKEGNPILVGKSSLDRTQFGMKPDPKEGNVVDFEFTIELLQK